MNNPNEAATACNQQIPPVDVNFTNNNNVVEITQIFPPGYRFLPTDTELILEYLKKKINNEELSLNHIPVINIYDYSPQQLSEIYAPIFDSKDKKIWYFYTPRDRKYTNGSRPSRTAGSGYWKATGADKEIYGYKGSETEKQIVGYKKVLVFMEGKPSRCVKTTWIMHEYVLHAEPRTRSSEDRMRFDDFVICRIYNSKPDKLPPNGQGSSIDNTNLAVQMGIDNYSITRTTTNDYNLFLKLVNDDKLFPEMANGENSIIQTANNDNIVDYKTILQMVNDDNLVFLTPNNYNSVLPTINNDNSVLPTENVDNSLIPKTETSADPSPVFGEPFLHMVNDDNLVFLTPNNYNSVLPMDNVDNSLIPKTETSADPSPVFGEPFLQMVNDDNSVLPKINNDNSVLQTENVDNSLIPKTETSADPSPVFGEPSEIENYFSSNNDSILLPSCHEFWSNGNYDPLMKEKE